MQHIAFPLPIKALLAAKVADAAYTIVRSTSNNATVGIGNECALKEFVGVVEIKVMDNAVAELRRKYLAFLWVVHYEAFARKRTVGTIVKVITQPFHILFQVAFPRLNIRPLRLMTLCIIICLIQVQ